MHRYSLTIGVDTNEIARQASNKKRAHDTTLWARYLDTAVSQALRQAAWENIGWAWPHAGEGAFDTAIVGAAIGMDYILSEMGFSALQTHGGALFIGWAGAALGKALWMTEEDQPSSEVCYSLLPYIHPDRAMLATLGTWGLRLVTATRP